MNLLLKKKEQNIKNIILKWTEKVKIIKLILYKMCALIKAIKSLLKENLSTFDYYFQMQENSKMKFMYGSKTKLRWEKYKYTSKQSTLHHCQSYQIIRFCGILFIYKYIILFLFFFFFFYFCS